MRQNNLVLMFGILALFLVGFSGAALSVTGVPAELSREGGSFTIVIETNETENITSISLSDSMGILTSYDPNETLPITIDNSSKSVKIDYTINEDFVFEYKQTYTANLKIEGNVSDSYEKTITFNENSNYFNNSISQNRGELSIDKMSLKLLDGLGSARDGEFFPFDEFELTFRIENDGDWNVRDVEFEICLYDVDEERCVYDEGDFSIDNERFSLRKGSRETITMSLALDLLDLEITSRDYELHLRAIGEIDDKDSEFDGNDTMISDNINLEVHTSEKFVIINDISSSYMDGEFTCGDLVTINAKAWNIDSRDLDDDEIYINVYNAELGIDEVITFDKGIYYMDYESFSFSFSVPNDLEEGEYKIYFAAYNNDRMYDKDLFTLDGKDSVYYHYINIVCDEKEPTITATLSSVAKVGREMIITGTITNERAYSQTYSLFLEGYSDWAELVSITPTEKDLASGASMDYSIVFKVLDSGEKDFALKIVDESGNEAIQKISVEVEGGFLSGLSLEGNSFMIYLIVGILVLLIILLVVLIVVASSKKKRRSIAMHN